MVRQKCEKTTQYGLKEPKLATTKKSDDSALEAILNKLGAMEDRISDMEKKSSEPPTLNTVTTTEINPYDDNRKKPKPPKVEGLLKQGDIVRLKDESETAEAIKRGSVSPEVQNNIAEKGILGVVDGYAMTSKSGTPKFRVKFPGIGVDGIYLSDLEVVERV